MRQCLVIVHAAVLLLLVSAPASVRAQGVREHTRLTRERPMEVTEAQATELTLTLTETAVRPIQIWVRTAGVIDHSRNTVEASLSRDEGALVSVGQRVRAFPPASRSRMSQARISHVAPQENRVAIVATLAGQALEGSTHYVLEIVTEAGEFLSVPNEAIIETEGRKVVYVPQGQGRYVAKEIRAGVQGELFTQVLEGLEPGEQVVTFGSFFIDAEYQLKGS
jgi:hypothetical protein